MQDPAAILDAFERLGWKNNDPMAQTLQLRLEDPKALGELVAQALDRSLPNATFIDAALDLMDDVTYVATVSLAWRRAMQGVRSDILSAVLDSTALQFPDVFAGHWEHLLAAAHAGEGGPEYLDGQAWRALDTATIDAWRAGLDADTSEGTLGHMRAIALLRSRRPDAVGHAWTLLFPDASDPAAASWLMLAGYAVHADGLRSLYTEAPLHIGFSAAQRKPMLAGQPAWRRDIHKTHPTWNTGTSPTHARMGGMLARACGLCHAPLHRLLSVQEPARAGIDSGSPIEFATCLSCQGWESDGPMFYRHDGDGVASAHPGQQRDTPLRPDFVAGALQDATVQLFAAPARWACQDWGESNGRQNLSRVGGAPSWVQSPDYPPCPDCHQDMAFVMQLDSGLPQADGGEWLWGSGGCNYTFWCAGCRVSGQLWQCT